MLFCVTLHISKDSYAGFVALQMCPSAYTLQSDRGEKDFHPREMRYCAGLRDPDCKWEAHGIRHMQLPNADWFTGGQVGIESGGIAQFTRNRRTVKKNFKDHEIKNEKHIVVPMTLFTLCFTSALCML